MTVGETGREQGSGKTGGTGGRGVGGRFRKGASGNPAGRPKGSRNRVTQLCADLLADDAGEIMAKLVKLAKKGDGVALKLCVERLVPVRAARDRFVEVDLPSVARAADLVDAAAAVIEGVASGRMTIAEGREFMTLLEGERRLIETTDLLVRVEAMEEQRGGLVAAPAVDGRGFGGNLASELGVRVRRLIDFDTEPLGGCE